MLRGGGEPHPSGLHPMQRTADAFSAFRADACALGTLLSYCSGLPEFVKRGTQGNRILNHP
ncbi:MAG: hypothetical protein D6812_01155 [Deltaproteobacteria bacterium]|nr:MAG: hypothetical protein D6812_01155 [Deltaproteobacteria bacterium]